MTMNRRRSRLRGLMMIRQEGEVVSINGGEVKMEIVECAGRRVKLMFQAAKEIRIEHEKKLPEPDEEQTTFDFLNK